MVNLFCEVLEKMVNLDILIDVKCKKSEEENTSRFRTGKDLFASQPARIGFISAAGEKIIGRPGDEKGIFTLTRVRTVVLAFFCLIVYTRRQKSDIITEISILAGKTKLSRKTPYFF